PRDLPVAGHEDEEIVALAATHDQGLDEPARLDAARRRGLREAAHRIVARHLERDAGRAQGSHRSFLAHAVPHPEIAGLPCLDIWSRSDVVTRWSGAVVLGALRAPVLGTVPRALHQPLVHHRTTQACRILRQLA